MKSEGVADKARKISQISVYDLKSFLNGSLLKMKEWNWRLQNDYALRIRFTFFVSQLNMATISNLFELKGWDF